MNKAHYENNKEYYAKKARVNAKAYEASIRKFLGEYLLLHPCVDCGNGDLRVLEFDHVRGVKLFSISDAVRRQLSQKKIEEEILKCDVRCANCHRIVTAERGGWHNSIMSL